MNEINVTFQNENDEEIGEVKSKDGEVESTLENLPYFQTAGGAVVSSSWLADVVSAGIFPVSLRQSWLLSYSLVSFSSHSVFSSRALGSIYPVVVVLKDSNP